MEFLKNASIKTLKIIGTIILRILMISGLLLLVGNIMFLFYNHIGNTIAYFFDTYMGSKIQYVNFSGDINTGTLGNINTSKLFFEGCDMGDSGGQGRFMIHFDKICMIEGINKKFLKPEDKQNIYHEMTHYKLRNLPIDQKILIRPKIIKQIDNIKSALREIKPEELTGDDFKYYRLLSGDLQKYASDPVYKFYDYTRDMIISYRGNEEYITYAVQFFMYVDKDNNLYFDKYDLKNSTLKEIDSGYKVIFKDIGMVQGN